MAFSCGGSPGYFNWDIVAGKKLQLSSEQTKRSVSVSFHSADSGTDFVRRNFLDGRRKRTARANEPPGGEDTTQYRGVSWVEKECKWQARITHKRKTYYLGGFQTKIDAARRYDEYAERLGRPMNFAPRNSNIERIFPPSARAVPLAASQPRATLGLTERRQQHGVPFPESFAASARQVSTSPDSFAGRGQDRLLMLATATANEQRANEEKMQAPVS